MAYASLHSLRGGLSFFTLSNNTHAGSARCLVGDGRAGVRFSFSLPQHALRMRSPDLVQGSGAPVGAIFKHDARSRAVEVSSLPRRRVLAKDANAFRRSTTAFDDPGPRDLARTVGLLGQGVCKPASRPPSGVLLPPKPHGVFAPAALRPCPADDSAAVRPIQPPKAIPRSRDGRYPWPPGEDCESSAGAVPAPPNRTPLDGAPG